MTDTLKAAVGRGEASATMPPLVAGIPDKEGCGLWQPKKKSDYVKVRTLSPNMLAVQAAVGFIGPCAIAPLVAVVDSAIINSVNGDKTPIVQGVKQGYTDLLLRPWKFVGSKDWRYMTFLVWCVYAGTYTTSNVVQTVHDSWEVSADMRKTGMVAVVNIGGTMLKDVLMVRYWGGKQGKSSTISFRTRSLFMLRDSMTMFATFFLADRVGRALADSSGMDAAWARRFGTIGTPTAIQALSTPLHLYALEFKENPTATTAQMTGAIQAKYGVACCARMARIAPALGLGSNINNELRDWAMRKAHATGFV